MTVPEPPHTGAVLALDNVIHDLSAQYEGMFSPETVDALVHETYDLLAVEARERRFLIVFTERFAKDRLLAAAQANGTIAKTAPEIFFMCVHNSGRSQMAAALASARSAGLVRVRSAGSQPRGDIPPVIIEAMAEIGLDLGTSFPKPMTDEVVRAADVIVTMGCGDACPVYPGKRYLDWNIADPAGQPLEVVRAIRNDLSAHLDRLLAELLPNAFPAASRHDGETT